MCKRCCRIFGLYRKAAVRRAAVDSVLHTHYSSAAVSLYCSQCMLNAPALIAQIECSDFKLPIPDVCATMAHHANGRNRA